jgi:hypothetical protein
LRNGYNPRCSYGTGAVSKPDKGICLLQQAYVVSVAYGKKGVDAYDLEHES